MIDKEVTTDGLNLLMACFAHWLVTSHSIQSMSVKAGTATKYVAAAATLLESFDTVAHRDARRRFIWERDFASDLKRVLAEKRRHEALPDRKEPFTIAMYHRSWIEANEKIHPDVLARALSDHYLIGIKGGYRQSEFIQKDQYEKVTGKCEMAPGQHGPRAFTLSDITFLNRRNNRISHEKAIANPKLVYKVRVRIRWQKNGEVHQDYTYIMNKH